MLPPDRIPLQDDGVRRPHDRNLMDVMLVMKDGRKQEDFLMPRYDLDIPQVYVAHGIPDDPP
jgi:hypothetical protein